MFAHPFWGGGVRVVGKRYLHNKALFSFCKCEKSCEIEFHNFFHTYNYLYSQKKSSYRADRRMDRQTTVLIDIEYVLLTSKCLKYHINI